MCAHACMNVYMPTCTHVGIYGWCIYAQMNECTHLCIYVHAMRFLMISLSQVVCFMSVLCMHLWVACYIVTSKKAGVGWYRKRGTFRLTWCMYVCMYVAMRFLMINPSENVCFMYEWVGMYWCMWACACEYVSMNVCIRVQVWVHTCMHVSIHDWLHTCMYP